MDYLQGEAFRYSIIATSGIAGGLAGILLVLLHMVLNLASIFSNIEFVAGPEVNLLVQRATKIVELALADPFGHLNDLTTVPDMIKDPRWQARLAENRLGAPRPTAPVLLYHGTADELIPFQVGEELRDRLCGLGASVQWQPVPLAGHIVDFIAASPLG